jgi:hypothetical protein
MAKKIVLAMLYHVTPVRDSQFTTNGKLEKIIPRTATGIADSRVISRHNSAIGSRSLAPRVLQRARRRVIQSYLEESSKQFDTI